MGECLYAIFKHTESKAIADAQLGMINARVSTTNHSFKDCFLSGPPSFMQNTVSYCSHCTHGASQLIDILKLLFRSIMSEPANSFLLAAGGEAGVVMRGDLARRGREAQLERQKQA
jgi:hypothetical protein